MKMFCAAWKDGSCDVAVLPFPLDGATPFMREHLFVCVPPEHALAKAVVFNLCGDQRLQFSPAPELGFWDTLCREKMPASKFLVQTDTAVFDELVQASSLPCFSTDYEIFRTAIGRVNIPLTDDRHISRSTYRSSTGIERMCQRGAGFLIPIREWSCRSGQACDFNDLPHGISPLIFQALIIGSTR